MTDTTTTPASITLEQAQTIVRKLLPDHDQTTVTRISDIKSKGYSLTAGTRTYIVDLVQPTEPDSEPQHCATFITIAPPTPLPQQWNSNTLPIIHNLLNEICAKTEVPLKQSILDTSLSLIPYHFLLSGTTESPCDAILSIADARQLGLLSEKANMVVDLSLGKLLGQLHTNVQNDWFGFPSLQPPADPSYSWQETFTSLLEDVLCLYEHGKVNIDFEIPFEKIRLYHSRAIAYSLFEDVEVPSLIWLTGSEHDVFIERPHTFDSETADPWDFGIVAILPFANHALWGDPLLESFFIPPNPSKAMVEGYFGAGGGALTILPRQNTKRIWYDLFLALLVLCEIHSFGDEDVLEERRVWCKQVILDSVDALKDAPYY